MGSTITPPRFVELSGGHNFRDIGGYATADGRQVAHGKVYRSGNLARLTDDDHALLAPLGLKLIIDLRSTHERAKLPSRLPTGVPLEIWARDHQGSTADLVSALTAPGATPADSRAQMLAIYRELPYEQAESYRALYLRIAAGDLPLLFHCAVGKDRTGIAAAFLLDLLDVPRERVIEDYLLTERFYAQNMGFVARDFSSTAMRGVDPAVLDPMMRAERAYLETAFETMQAEHGGVVGYCQDVLGLDAGVIEAMRAVLVV
jgi:protein-tyrosine phosphatase